METRYLGSGVAIGYPETVGQEAYRGPEDALLSYQTYMHPYRDSWWEMCLFPPVAVVTYKRCDGKQLLRYEQLSGLFIIFLFVMNTTPNLDGYSSAVASYEQGRIVSLSDMQQKKWLRPRSRRRIPEGLRTSLPLISLCSVRVRLSSIPRRTLCNKEQKRRSSREARRCLQAVVPS
jgi:hypothetical protein